MKNGEVTNLYLIQFAIFEVDRHRFKQLLKRKNFKYVSKNRFITCLSYGVNGVCKKSKAILKEQVISLG